MDIVQGISSLFTCQLSYPQILTILQGLPLDLFNLIPPLKPLHDSD